MEDTKHEIRGSYLFGPVPSRRLGLSLGVDIVPLKACTQDCIYCQLGRSSDKTIRRKNYVPVETVLEELKKRLEQGLQADYITISGSGEPTLNTQLGRLVEGIKKITDIPVAILTNGTLLYDPQVRADCAKADVVLPSLDAGDEETFQKINRPHKDINLEKLIAGLIAFRKEFNGQIWLEVFFLDGINTDERQIANINTIITQIRPDRIQLNTAVRPTAERGISIVDQGTLSAIARQLGPKAEVIADFQTRHHNLSSESNKERLLEMLRRRPCSLDDICAGLGIHRNEALKHLGYFQQIGVVRSEQTNATVYFVAR